MKRVTMTMDELRERLQKFEFLSAQSKIELWLCYRDLKPVSAFPMMVDFADFAVDQEKLSDWIREAGLFYKKHAESGLYIVSKRENLIDKLLPIVFSNEKQDIVTKCKLFMDIQKKPL